MVLSQGRKESYLSEPRIAEGARPFSSGPRLLRFGAQQLETMVKAMSSSVARLGHTFSLKGGLQPLVLVRGFPLREEEVLVQAGPFAEAALVERSESQCIVRQREMHF